MKRAGKQTGFTIVELLIVVVVIAILAAITIVSYNGISSQARDSQRKNDISVIAKALEMYYIDNGRFPSSAGDSSTINDSWSTTVDSSWSHLRSQLVPKYISNLPTDPQNTLNKNVHAEADARGYAYFTNTSAGAYCGVNGSGQMYLLSYRLEGGQKDTFIGDCSSMALSYGSSDYRVAK